MTTNAEMLQQAGAALDGIGVRKANTVMTTQSMQAGEFMDRTHVERLVDLTVSQSGWLSVVSMKMRRQRSGQLPRMVLNETVTEGVPENGGKTISSHPGTDFVPYNCAKFQATWFLTVEDIREAKASGEPDFESKVRRMFAKAMGNDMAKWALRGDTTLGTGTRLNRLLRTRDGWLKQARAKAIRNTTTYGAPFDRSLFTAMHANMPEEYRDDADLRWFMPSILDIAWTDSLRDPTNGDHKLRDDATTQRRRFEPYGIPQLITPQMPTDAGFSTVNGVAVDPDAAADNGGAVLITLQSLFGGYDAKWAGRSVKVTLKSSGASEIGTVLDPGGSLLTVQLSGDLGQAVISTTAADYALELADLTSALLTNPANLFLVMCDQVRAYRKFEQEAERWRIDVFYEADAGIFNEGAIVMQDGVTAPKFAFGGGF